MPHNKTKPDGESRVRGPTERRERDSGESTARARPRGQARACVDTYTSASDDGHGFLKSCRRRVRVHVMRWNSRGLQLPPADGLSEAQMPDIYDAAGRHYHFTGTVTATATCSSDIDTRVLVRNPESAGFRKLHVAPRDVCLEPAAA